MSETLEFKAELKQLLHLIVHSLYSDREIFLRELISNASDAINKVKFNSLDKDDQLEGNKDWKIKLIPDRDAKTLTVRDNGIGMSRAEAIDQLGTVAKSGTKAFLAAVREAKQGESPSLIGQFGVGFYSAYMVADRVTVLSRPAGTRTGVRWQSDGQGQFTVEEIEKADRGTDVILHLKEDALDFLDPWRLKSLVRKFSDFLEHPVVMDAEEDKDGQKVVTEEILNSRKAIWLRPRQEVTDEEYDAFYRSMTHAAEPPAKVLHFSTEGKTEFKALLFIPADRPLSFEWEEPKAGLKLYVQRVLIMDRCEQLLPMYLRFVSGVVDSADLPLNVSREMLQQNPHLDTIQKNVVKNVLDGLAGLKNTQPEKYRKFYDGLGAILKEGLTRDFTNREKIADLLLFQSAKTPSDQRITLAEYVERMPAGQEHIHTIAGESAELLRQSPYLESIIAKGQDVMFLTDPIDEFAIPVLREYRKKPFQAVDRGELKDGGTEIPADLKSSFAGFLDFAKQKLPQVSEVRLTHRLTDSASCLVADAGAMTAHMERLLKKFGEPVDMTKRILELNPNHPTVQAVRDLYSRGAGDTRLDDFVQLLHDQAVLAEGSKLTDLAGFSKRLNALMARAAG